MVATPTLWSQGVARLSKPPVAGRFCCILAHLTFESMCFPHSCGNTGCPTKLQRSTADCLPLPSRFFETSLEITSCTLHGTMRGAGMHRSGAQESIRKSTRSSTAGSSVALGRGLGINLNLSPAVDSVTKVWQTINLCRRCCLAIGAGLDHRFLPSIDAMLAGRPSRVALREVIQSFAIFRLSA